MSKVEEILKEALKRGDITRIPECINPGHRVKYSKAHDAYYCIECDFWLESYCPDTTCMFCKNRPKKPSQTNRPSR